jgi:hypothetical protein
MILIMRFAEIFAAFVIVKAVYEFYMNNKLLVKEKGIYGSIEHSYQHMAALIGIITYNIFDIMSFIYFEDVMNEVITDYSISFFNIMYINIVWLIMIDHFKQERKGKTKVINIKDLFKF